MEIIKIKTEEIKPYIFNPRKNDEAVEVVAESIKEFGFKVPIVLDKNNEIIAGHTRLKAAEQLGYKEVPCIIADDLDEAQVKAFRLADNRTNEIAEWDFEKLKGELEELENLDFDMSNFSFDDMGDFNELLANDIDVEEDDYTEEDMEQVETKSKLGDIYQLGDHRLMCGDSTDKEAVDKLMNGEKADMILTDPPYNIDYEGIKENRKIKNDKMTDENFTDFIKEYLGCVECNTVYMFCSWQCIELFKKAMELNKTPAKALIVWDKIIRVQNLDKYFKQHELLLYSGEFGGVETIRGDVWEIKRERNTIHPTMKPIELLSIAIKDNPKKINI